METKFQTSFIPKAPVSNDFVSRRTSGAGFLFIISFIIFIASACIAGGVYFYSKILDERIASGNNEISDNKNIFSPTIVQEYSRLNDRINASYEILKKHIAVSNLFDVLSAVTLKTVRFTNFTYTNGGGDKITISMNGQAKHYESVALQARAFTDPTMKYRNAFKSPIFGDINADTQGNVSFNLSTSLDPSVISYYRLVQDLKRSGQLDAYANIFNNGKLLQNSQVQSVDNPSPAPDFNSIAP